ncbi:hypothetical protein ACFT5D_05045 [Streptomyces sp. NPDC057144]|uniref:hypothetical protein n=1 Tax=Streptomyces TaxID=1883 RepID=UPI002852BA4E|nr:hypothetical protein [Streptomyces salinarius]
MVELGILAAAAVGIAGDFLAGVVQNAAASAVTELVRQRLRSTEDGATALERLEETPQDSVRRMDASNTLAGAAQRDPAFARSLTDAVNLYHQVTQQGTATSGSPHHQVNISGGGVSGKGALVAGGNIDASKKRSIRIGIGAFAVLAVVLGGYGVTQWVGGDSDTTPGAADGQGWGTPISARSVGSIGADPGEAGVRETWDAFGEALKDRDFARMCALYTPEAQQTLEEANGECEAYMETAAQSSNSDYLSDDGRRILVKDVQVQGKAAQVTLAPQGNLGDVSYLFMDRFVDRWRISANDYRTDFSDR